MFSLFSKPPKALPELVFPERNLRESDLRNIEEADSRLQAVVNETRQLATAITMKLSNEMEQQRRKMMLLSDCLLDALLMLDANGNVAYVNKYAQKMFGYNPSDLHGQSINFITSEYVDPNFIKKEFSEFYEFVSEFRDQNLDVAMYRTLYERYSKRHTNGCNTSKVVPAVTKSGVVLDVELTYNIMNPEATPDKYTMLIQVKDVSDRIRSQMQLIEREAQLHTLINGIPDCVTLSHTSGELIYANDSAQAFYSTKDSCVGEFRKFVDGLNARLPNASRETKSFSDMFGFDHTYDIFKSQVAVNGQTVVLTVWSEVTHLVHHQQQSMYLASALNAIPNVVFVTDGVGHILFVNRAVLDFNLDPADFLDRHINSVIDNLPTSSLALWEGRCSFANHQMKVRYRRTASPPVSYTYILEELE